MEFWQMESWVTELFKAIELDDFERLQTLLANEEADVNSSDIDTGQSLLSLSIVLGNLKIVRLIISAGADINLPNDEGYTPLMRAAEIGNIEAVKLLVKAGAIVNMANTDGGTAISNAAWAGEKEVVEYLLAFCSSKEREYALQILPSGIRRKQRRSEPRTIAFIEAVQRSDFEAVRDALANGVDINAFSEDGETALYIAASRGDIEMINLLLQAGADCELRAEVQGWTPLMEAAYLNLPEVINLLIKGGANVNAIAEQYGSTALSIAIISQSRNLTGDFGIVKTASQALGTVEKLIKSGADIELKDKFGNTAFMIAYAVDATEIVQFLKLHKAKEEGIARIELIKAAQLGNIELIRELLNFGIDVNVADYCGITPLIIACERGHYEIAELLIKHGAKININHFNTPLIAAVKGGHVKIVKMLINCGVNVNLKASYNGSTALDCSLGLHPEIEAILRDAGATET